MKKLAIGMCFFSASSHLVAEGSTSIDHTGQCFALFEFSRQVSDDPYAKSIFKEAADRASKTLVRMKAVEGYPFKTSDPEAFTQQMRDILVYYGSINSGLDEEQLAWLWDMCEAEYL